MSTTEPTAVTQLTAVDTLGADFAGLAAAAGSHDLIADPLPADDDEDTTESLTLSLPDALVPPVSDRDNPRWTLQLYSSDCLDCDELVDGGQERGLKKKCHFSKNNPHCPAANVSLVYVGAFMKLVQRGREAKESNDPSKLLLFMNKLSEQDAALQQRVLRELGMLNG